MVLMLRRRKESSKVYPQRRYPGPVFKPKQSTGALSQHLWRDHRPFTGSTWDDMLICQQHALESSDLPDKYINVLVAGAGTGGTVTGLSNAVRDRRKADPSVPPTTVVAVDPVGSILGGGEPGNYVVEGIGYVSPRPVHWKRRAHT